MPQFLHVLCPECHELLILGQLSSELWQEMDRDTQVYFFHNMWEFLAAFWEQEHKDAGVKI